MIELKCQSYCIRSQFIDQEINSELSFSRTIVPRWLIARCVPIFHEKVDCVNASKYRLAISVYNWNLNGKLF